MAQSFNVSRFLALLVVALFVLFAGGCSSSMSLPLITDDVYGKIYSPPGGGVHPAVVVLHGSGGMRPVYLEEAQLLAEHGYVALVLDYYTGIGNKGYTQETRLENWNLWMKRVEDSLSYLRTLPEVDGDRIALVGFSQGAALALFSAAEDPRIKVVADFFGPRIDGWYVENRIGYVPESLDDVLENLPPVIILHGRYDITVPVGSSEKLRDELVGRGKVAELHIYDGAGHAFNDPEAFFRSEPGVAEDAREKVMAFLRRYLRGDEE